VAALLLVGSSDLLSSFLLLLLTAGCIGYFFGSEGFRSYFFYTYSPIIEPELGLLWGIEGAKLKSLFTPTFTLVSPPSFYLKLITGFEASGRKVPEGFPVFCCGNTKLLGYEDIFLPS
jgi:hypothetical protein